MTNNHAKNKKNKKKIKKKKPNLSKNKNHVPKKKSCLVKQKSKQNKITITPTAYNQERKRIKKKKLGEATCPGIKKIKIKKGEGNVQVHMGIFVH